MEINECIYQSNVSIKYVFEKSAVTKNPLHDDWLVVMFSAFNSPESERQYSYNYMRACQGIPCTNRLYILDDYGPRGCYYIGKDMKYDVETSVISLILWICAQNNIPWSNVIMAGSSKGGSAALYFGLKYNAGHVVCGAPQIYIADYVNSAAKETLSYLIGEASDSARYTELNQLIFKQLEKHLYTKINILTSENDWQYAAHVLPFENMLIQKNIPANVDVSNVIKNHNDIGTYYPFYLQRYVLREMYGINIQNIEFKAYENVLSVWIDTEFPLLDEFKFEVLVYKGNNIAKKTALEEQTWEYVLTINGIYNIDVSLLYHGNMIFHMRSKQLSVGSEVCRIQKTQLTNEGTKLYFELIVESEERLKYAFYV